MVKLKNKQQIATMRQGGKILAQVLALVIKKIKPGVGTEELSVYAEELIKKAGGKPSFKGYRASWAEHAYPSALCLSLNNEVVHGLPVPNRIIKSGDIVGIDCGLEYRGLFTDMAKTVAVGSVGRQIRKLISVTEESLSKGIRQAKAGNKLTDISRAIQDYVEKNGFSVVRQLCGHGVGFSPHEDPQIPNYVDKRFADIKLAVGMTLALEPMVNFGDWPVETLDDGWTVATRDNSLSAHFEHTIAVTERGGEIITTI
ncbi:MAG: type I methionyl aminopeptidase [Patescibacteria group bacterium]